MGVEINIRTISNGRLRRRLERIEHPLPGLIRAGLAVAAQARRKLSARQIKNRVSTGQLARSINVQPSNAGKVTVGTNLKYAAIQNYGRPDQHSSRTNGLLAIPATMALRQSGVWPRDFGDKLDFIPLKNKGHLKGMLVLKESDDQREKRQELGQSIRAKRKELTATRNRASAKARSVIRREERSAIRRARRGTLPGTKAAHERMADYRVRQSFKGTHKKEGQLSRLESRRAKLARPPVMFWCVDQVNIPHRKYLDAKDPETKTLIRNTFEEYLNG